MSKCNSCNQVLDNKNLCSCNRPAGAQIEIQNGAVAPQINSYRRI